VDNGEVKRQNRLLLGATSVAGCQWTPEASGHTHGIRAVGGMRSAGVLGIASHGAGVGVVGTLSARESITGGGGLVAVQIFGDTARGWCSSPDMGRR